MLLQLEYTSFVSLVCYSKKFIYFCVNSVQSRIHNYTSLVIIYLHCDSFKELSSVQSCKIKRKGLETRVREIKNTQCEHGCVFSYFETTDKKKKKL